MPRKETSILLLLLGCGLLGCEKPSENIPIPPEPAEISSAVESTDPDPSILVKEREKIDHDAKFRPRKETDPNWIIFNDFKSPKPKTWSWTTPSSNMRLANYLLQGARDTENIELVITQYEGGELSNTIARLKSQFRSGGGASLRPTIKTITVADLPTTIVEITGEYMGLGSSYHHHDYTMLIALIEYETDTISLRLLGTSHAINEHRETWNSFLENITYIAEN